MRIDEYKLKVYELYPFFYTIYESEIKNIYYSWLHLIMIALVLKYSLYLLYHGVHVH
jgi:hypothetical protein